jgi:hypothetical protein
MPESGKVSRLSAVPTTPEATSAPPLQPVFDVASILYRLGGLTADVKTLKEQSKGHDAKFGEIREKVATLEKDLAKVHASVRMASWIIGLLLALATLAWAIVSVFIKR